MQIAEPAANLSGIFTDKQRVTRRALHGGGFSLGLAAVALLLAMPPVSKAQAANRDLMSMPLEDLVRVQVYSASRHSEDISKAPSSVSIITAEDIRRYGWRTLGEALRSLRGFYISDNRQYTYLGVRGFMRPGDDNPRILLLVDGHRLNDKIYDTAAIGTEFPLDLDLVDHIEVVRGPGSSLYGTNAIFGVINIITREPRQETAVEVNGDAGSLWSRRGRATLMGSRGQWSGLLSGSMYRSAGNAQLYFPIFDTPLTNNGIAENGDGSHDEQAFAELRYRDIRIEGLLADRVRQFPTGAAGAVFDDPANHENDARGYIEASLSRKLGADTDLDVAVHYDAYDYAGSGDYGPPGVSPLAVRVKSRADWVGVDGTVTQHFGKQQFTAGAEYEYDLGLKQWTYAVGQPDVFRSDEKPWLGAVYGDAELNVIPQLTLHAGARWDKASNFHNSVSPRGAAIWTPDDRTAVKYIVGMAFRDPNAYEAYYADGVTVVPGPAPLTPEQILSHELVLDRSLKAWLSLTVDGFYNRLKELISQVPEPDTTVSYFVNHDRMHAKGLEAELVAQSGTGWSARATYAATMTGSDTNDQPPQDAPHTLATLHGSAPLGSWGTAGLELLYVSAMSDERGTRVPASLLPNLTFGTKPLWGGWQFSSSLYDALNRRWSSPAGPNDPEDQMQMDGRGWRFQAGYRLPVRGGGRER